MRLAVFDIDGTLTDTVAVDERCYLAALTSVLDLAPDDVGEWRGYPQMTDSAIAATAVERTLGREIEEEELEVLEEVFVAALTAEFDGLPALCRPIAGAVEFLAALERRHGWTVALATGGFRSSALLKLVRAGFEPPLLLATASEARSRQEIVRAAIEAATAHAGPVDEWVVLGDGLWDVATAEDLGIPCVGVGAGAAGRRLRAAGAAGVLSDFADATAAYEVLAAAAAPAVRD